MNWYRRLKLAQIHGEWWIDDSGSAMYADGDVGDANHETHVIDAVLHKYLDIPEFTDANSNEFIDGYIQENWEEVVEWMINVEGLISEDERQLAYAGAQNESPSNPGENFFELASNNMALSDILKMNGASDEEANIAIGQGDVRLSAAKNWGWVRVQGREVEAFRLTSDVIRRIANGLYDAYGEDAESATYNVFSYENKKWFNDVPFHILESGNPAALRQYQFVGW